MAAAAAAVGRPKRLPVFVSPDELQFVSEEESSHKQILTLFNPYDFNIRFKGVGRVEDDLYRILSIKAIYT